MWRQRIRGEADASVRRTIRPLPPQPNHLLDRPNPVYPSTPLLQAPVDQRTFVRYRRRMADDRQYLARLQDYYARHRVLPSYARIGAMVGLNSKASVAGMV